MYDIGPYVSLMLQVTIYTMLNIVMLDVAYAEFLNSIHFAEYSYFSISKFIINF
jgi:hypothetical protein